eukprot:CAMPEP_0178614226 /NCGR_PEP_ID=MMETSP0698-20121128/2053_1 /TAXON_ID=265572 /ORGANISM="Extubocellulus spinifer, Strain CCMP396" /LENGTH=1059 /DNA_ID=CAMNT_0020252951 /DNA_START=319 /DNA_END=3499 /DNA_ORIENTATION=-
MKTPTDFVSLATAVAALVSFLPAAVVVEASTSTTPRHWARLIPSNRLAELTLDDAHLHLPPTGSHMNHDGEQQQQQHQSTLLENPTSPQAVSAALEKAHDDAVSAAIAAGASIAEIENMAFGGGSPDAAAIMMSINRLDDDPAAESSPHVFSMDTSDTQPWLAQNEMDKFVGGREKLRPDIEEWIEIVQPELVEEQEQVTLAEIVSGAGGTATTTSWNTGGSATVATAIPSAGAGTVAGSYTIDPVTGVYLDSYGNVITDPSVLPGTGSATTTTAAGDGGGFGGDPTKDFSGLLPNTAPSTPSTNTIVNTSPTIATTTTATSSSTTSLSELQNLIQKPDPTSRRDPTIQGGVQLQSPDLLPYPLSLPWYPKDGRPWVDPVDLPTFTHPVVDAISNAANRDVGDFIRNQYWDNGYWTPESYYGYGPPCSVSEVVAYTQEKIAQGVLPKDTGTKLTGMVGKDGKINGGKVIPPLNYRGDQKWLGGGSLARCEGDCDEDADCGPGLVCHQRKGREVVPGCANWGKDGERKIGSPDATDYCVREIDEAAHDAGFYDDYDDDDMEMQVIDAEMGLLLPHHCSGPQGWADVVASYTPEAKYWEQFSQWIGPSLLKNQCGVSVEYNHNPTNNDFAGIFGAVAGVVGREIDDEDNAIDEEALTASFETRVVNHQQSPIDIRRSMANELCYEYHQIRHKTGDFDIRGSYVKTQILPNKLRLDYHQDYNENKYSDGVGGPSADMPKGWGHQLPLTHIDVKIPSEHWLEGKQYAAEYQIFLIQTRDSQRGAPVISILIDLHPTDYPNIKFQEMLDQFQKVWDADMADCESLVRRRRRVMASLAIDGNEGSALEDELLKVLGDDNDSSVWAEALGEEDAQFENYRSNIRRRAQEDEVWDPWHEDIMTSHYFLGYEGSLTEPPCTEFLSWRIMDRPALVSKAQLSQMKKLLFSHVDGKCRPTSNHHEGSVARPLQPFNDREMWQCTCRDYIGDDERKWYDRNRCWAGDEEVFHERTEDGLYWASMPPQAERRGVFDCGGDVDLTPPCCGKTYDPSIPVVLLALVERHPVQPA